MSTALLAILANAGSSGLLISDAAAQVARRPDEEHETETPLLLAAANNPASDMLAHGSHRSHSSHRSHYSGSGGSGGGGSGGSDYVPSDPVEQTVPATPPPPPPPPPPKPASVSLVAFPGGRITLAGNVVGYDATSNLTLKPGSYEVRVQNRFLGEHVETIQVTDAQTGVITIDW